MLHNINFMDWQHHQRLQKKRHVLTYFLCTLTLFIGAEIGCLLYAQHEQQLVVLTQHDNQALVTKVEGLKLRQHKGEVLAEKSKELQQTIDLWSYGRWNVYQIIHGLALSINSSVSVEQLTQNDLNIELNGYFSSVDKFNHFIYQLGSMKFIDDISVESVSTKVNVTGQPSRLYHYRIQIRLNGGVYDDGRTELL